MHPESIPLGLPPGRLYMKTPAGDVVPLHYNMAEITQADEPWPDKTESGWINPAPLLPEISIELTPTPAFEAWIHGMVQSYNARMAEQIELHKAAIRGWALTYRPDLHRVWRRTKKKRTRKKYWQRIYRAYKEAMLEND